ncbi:MAG: sigma-54 dependent transcriptional regulator [Myxococcota bacterium]
MSAELLLIDDDEAVGFSLGALLRQAGYAVTHTMSAQQGLKLVRDGGVDLVVLDLRMPDIDGLQALKQIRDEDDELPVIMLTAQGSVSDAVAAMKLGASDFLTKPYERDALLYAVQKSLRVSEVERDKPPGRRDVHASTQDLDALIAKAARSEATVMIRGESGTGKEVTARKIHALSKRADGPFVKIHCAAIPDHLLESELFGYEKGAFTGAAIRKPGRFELAAGGTIFLDEIGDVSPAVQVKLLRVIQDREFERLGGHDVIRTDARFVVATHRDLEAMVADGSFREDFFYRLNVIPVHLAPLRERPHDVRRLAGTFCAEFSEKGGVDRTLTSEAMDVLETHRWPGNVRELQNVIERLVVLSDDSALGPEAIREALAIEAPAIPPPKSRELASAVGSAERQAIEAALEKTSGNRTQAARLLGISRRSLYYKLDAYDLD